MLLLLLVLLLYIYPFPSSCCCCCCCCCRFPGRRQAGEREEETSETEDLAPGSEPQVLEAADGALGVFEEGEHGQVEEDEFQGDL